MEKLWGRQLVGGSSNWVELSGGQSASGEINHTPFILRLKDRHTALQGGERASLSKKLAILLEVAEQFQALSKEDKAR